MSDEELAKAVDDLSITAKNILKGTDNQAVVMMKIPEEEWRALGIPLKTGEHHVLLIAGAWKGKLKNPRLEKGFQVYILANRGEGGYGDYVKHPGFSDRRALFRILHSEVGHLFIDPADNRIKIHTAGNENPIEIWPCDDTKYGPGDPCSTTNIEALARWMLRKSGNTDHRLFKTPGGEAVAKEARQLVIEKKQEHDKEKEEEEALMARIAALKRKGGKTRKRKRKYKKRKTKKVVKRSIVKPIKERVVKVKKIREKQDIVNDLLSNDGI